MTRAEKREAEIREIPGKVEVPGMIRFILYPREDGFGMFLQGPGIDLRFTDAQADAIAAFIRQY